MLSVCAVAQIVHAIAHFAIADQLAGGPATAAEIAARCHMDPLATEPLLQACGSLGLVLPAGPLRFATTPMLDMLRWDVPGSVRELAAAVAALSAQSWEGYKKCPERVAELAGGVSEVTAMAVKEVAEVIDTRPLQLAAVIGAGGGPWVHALMTKNPCLHGLVLEPPERVSTASLAPRWRGMRSRLSVVGGDVLSPVPPADLYLLKYILHDWEAATCVRILASCRRALQPDGRVVVIEMQLEEPRRPLFAPAQPAVLVAPPGRERTLPEYEELYLEAGLRLLSTASTRSGRLVLQAVPAW